MIYLIGAGLVIWVASAARIYSFCVTMCALGPRPRFWAAIVSGLLGVPFLVVDVWGWVRR